jgi:phosphoglycolate phosphatase-like HAD superfamily hydrolase
MNTIALFDIDKTLINRSTAHLKAFFLALDAVYGVTAEPNVITHHGMTDQQIIREVLKVKGIDQAVIDAGLKRCMQVMVDKFNELNPADTVELLPGVTDLLAALAGRGTYRGLVTGNLEAIAWAKLAKADIARYFAFGGFGSDDEDRGKMAALAVRRCCSLYNIDITGSRIVLFGDTPYDIAAARAIGAFAVGVATGHPSKQQLTASGADIVLENLADTRTILQRVFD